MSKWSKPLSILMSLVLAVGLCPAPAFADDFGLSGGRPAGAGLGLSAQSASHTRDEAVAWARSQIGKWLDYDKAYGAQCVDLTKYYYDYLGVGARTGNGYAYANGNLPGGWTRSSTPQPGDVAAWAAGKGVAGSVGHVAIVVEVSGSRFTVVEQSGNTTACRYNTYATSNPSNFLRPDWPSSGPALSGKPQVSVGAGTYMIRSKIGNRVIDVDNAKSDNGANAQIWQPLGNKAQIFNVGWNDAIKGNYMQLAATGKFLDSAGGAGQVNVHQWEGNGTEAQNWIFEDAGDGYVYVRNLHGYYLDVADGRNANGTNVHVWSFNGSDAQKWKFIPASGKTKTRVADGQYAVRSKVGARVIDVDNAKSDNGANAQIWQPLGNKAQIFNVGWNSDLDANYIQLASSGKFLDAAGGDGQVNVQQFEGNGTYAQNWMFEDAGDGYYYIRNLLGYYLDVDDGRDANGTNVHVWSFNGSDAQKWRLCKVSGKTKTRAADGSYAVQTKLGNLVLDVKGASLDNTANIRLAKPGAGASQIFNVGWNSDLDANYIQLAKSGKLVDAAGGDGAVNVWQFEGNGGKGQHWMFEDAGDGYYYIRNLCGYYLSVDGGKAADGQNVSTAVFNGSDAQKWKLAKPSVAKASIAGAAVAKVKARKYTGKPIKPKPKVTYKGKALKRGADYTLSYKDNKKRGTATITVKGKGDFKGTKTVKFKIK